MGMEIQGASTLQNWAELILLSKTNVQDLRLMIAAKSRGFRWDSKTFTLKIH